MYCLKYKITTKNPVLISDNVGDPNMVQTSQYIPGSSLWGAFAGKFETDKEKKDLDDDFYAWFLQGQLHFTNGYIASQDHRSNWQTHFPLPLSIQKDKDTHNIYDFRQYVGNDQQRTSQVGGYGRFLESDILRETVSRSLNFHHSRKRGQGISKEAQIFNYESIDPHQHFIGCILGPQEQLEKFQKKFNKESYTMFLGRSRNTQYGRCQLEFLGAIEEFKSEIPSWQDTALMKNPLTLTLLSDTIVYNSQGFSSVDPRDLEKYLSQELNGEVKVQKAFVRSGVVENFLSIWRLRRPSEICYQAGSTWTLEAKGVSDDDLLALQKSGMGIRREEGFGRLVFGWQEDPELSMGTITEREVQKPGAQMPAMVKKIAIKAVQRSLRQVVQAAALSDSNSFPNKRLPKNNLIGRLESIALGEGADNFTSALGKLRKTAKDSLEKCYHSIDNTDLFDFLKKLPGQVNTWTTTDAVANKATDFLEEEEVGYDPSQDEEFKSQLFREYCQTFFGLMRKNNKGSK